MRMPQGTVTAGFSVTELMHIVLGYLPPVPLELRSHSALGSRPLKNCDLHIGIDDVTTTLPSDGSDGSEPSLLLATGSSQMPPVFFYMDNIFSAHSSFEDAFVFLRDHLLIRIEWSMLKLLFKKLVLFTSSITALRVEHQIHSAMRVKQSQSAKIATWPVPTNVTAVRSFLGSIGVTR
jgi:hypothetical protein